MGAQRQRFRVLRIKLFYQLGPDHAGRAHLGDFHEEVHANRPEERQTRREFINRKTRRLTGARIFDAIGQRIGELKISRRTGFLHVIAGNRDRVEFRHVLRGKGKDVRNDAHRWFRRIDIGVAHHEFFQNVILNGARKLFVLHTLFFGSGNIKRHHRQNRAIHGHGNRHLIKRDAIKKGAHVIDAVNRHTGHADITGDTRMITVIATVGRQIEGNRKAFLPGGKVAAIERVGFLGGGETGILADRPGTLHIHGGIGAAQKWRHARHGVQVINAVQIPGPIG